MRSTEVSQSRITLRLAFAGTIALVSTLVLWELVLAPLRPGGSWLALKALPLALLIPGVMRRQHRALQWLALLLPFYVAEGIVRGWSEGGRHALVAWVAAVLSTATFVAVLGAIRNAR
ncbi:MAG TPA: DUF2069 domain-containing protein [Casimicrobiaceae bacterium]|nr:DUF2069 domain-containing protein [Casimicrobiaceae bacterium]